MKKMIDGEIVDMTEEEIAALILAQEENTPEQGPYRLYKSTFIRRMSNDEASAMRGVLNAATDKLQMLYDAVEYFVSDDPLFNELMAATSHALGASRASELLKEE